MWALRDRTERRLRADAGRRLDVLGMHRYSSRTGEHGRRSQTVLVSLLVITPRR
jgi:hypothetical protein